MKPYISLSGKESGVVSFDYTENSITVKFRDNPKLYKYNADQNGEHIAIMIKKAINSIGLSTYIAEHKKILKFTYV